LGKLANLQKLFLHDNQLSGQFFYFSEWSVPTDHLIFHAGTIPESLAKLGKLEFLHLCGNQLSGHFFMLFCWSHAD
jgi:hypothetical protein